MLLPLLLLWTTIGVVVGFLVSKCINLRGDDPRAGIFLAGIGAAAAGLSYNLFSGFGLVGWNRWSCLYAALGGLLVVTVWHLVRSRYVLHATYSTRRSY